MPKYFWSYFQSLLSNTYSYGALLTRPYYNSSTKLVLVVSLREVFWKQLKFGYFLKGGGIKLLHKSSGTHGVGSWNEQEQWKKIVKEKNAKSAPWLPKLEGGGVPLIWELLTFKLLPLGRQTIIKNIFFMYSIIEFNVYKIRKQFLLYFPFLVHLEV